VKTFLKNLLYGFSLAAFATAGCSNSSNNSAASNTSGTPSGATTSTRTGASNALTIISPHGKEIQVEFERGFKTKFPDAKFKWIDQGGSSDDLRYVLDQFKGKSGEQGIGIDVFFGGGADSFQDMEGAKVLQSLPSEYSIPAELNGVPLRGANNTWVAAALSSFGILYNKAIMERDKLPIPRTWADLGNPKLNNRVALADPRHSGSAHMAYEIILQANSWEKGWGILTQMAGNSTSFGKSSSSLLEQVASGDAVAAPAIDFYAASKVEGADGKLGYVEPAGQRVITADPIGILRGAPNAQMAREFVGFVMSPAGQKLWMMKKGTSDGPQNTTLYRQAALPSLYKPIAVDSTIQSDPYASRNNFKFDPQKSALRRRALDDLLGAVLIDNLQDVQSWTKENGANNKGFVPLSEAEFMKLAAKWNDQTLRNSTMSAWSQKARAFFQ
jgi:ABC-type Fe3+ transport system substrate-binding protein